jgi:hypothetical protein
MNWLKSTGLFLGVMVIWDIARIFIQAKVNQRVLKKNFQNVRKDIDELEEDVERVLGGSREQKAFATFIKALDIDAKENPEKLKSAKEVWDKEWNKLLKGIKDK